MAGCCGGRFADKSLVIVVVEGLQTNGWLLVHSVNVVLSHGRLAGCSVAIVRCNCAMQVLSELLL